MRGFSKALTMTGSLGRKRSTPHAVGFPRFAILQKGP